MSQGFAGSHHLALYTHDLDATLRFYSEVLGLEASGVADSPRGRHAFVYLEPKDSGRHGLHFSEDVERDPPDVECHLASFTSGPGSLAHLALYHPDASAAAALRARLKADRISFIDFAELGTYAFSDPNGVMVEIAAAHSDER